MFEDSCEESWKYMTADICLWVCFFKLEGVLGVRMTDQTEAQPVQRLRDEKQSEQEWALMKQIWTNLSHYSVSTCYSCTKWDLNHHIDYTLFIREQINDPASTKGDGFEPVQKE